VGLYCDYENLNAIVSLAEKISQDPGYPILMGGPQAIALDEAFLQKHPFVKDIHLICEIGIQQFTIRMSRIAKITDSLF
jgi:hypothetical protein